MTTVCKITESSVKRWIIDKTIDAHQQELLQLLYLHPDAARKQLHKAVRVRQNKHEKMGLVAVLKDGSVESFAWRKVFGHPKHETAADNVKKAFRGAIYDQTRAVRIKHGYVGRSEYHVGHGHNGTPSFEQLLNTFLKHRGLSLQNIQVHKACKPPLEYRVWQLEDTCLLQEWQEFHREHACLAIEHQTSNLRNLLVKEPSL